MPPAQRLRQRERAGASFFALLVPCESFDLVYTIILKLYRIPAERTEGALPLFPEEGRNERETILRQRKHRRAEGRRPGRKRPGVIFGSDGLDGCEHAVFEILSNAIDEAREGYGRLITVTRYADHSIEVEDQGRGCPVDWNPKEEKFNWGAGVL